MSYCSAKRTNGEPCRGQAISGATVCRVHGGNAPQVREAARLRLLELVDPALGVLARAVRKRKDPKWEPTATEIQAARDLLDRAGLKPEQEAPPNAPGGGITLVVMPAGIRAPEAHPALPPAIKGVAIEVRRK